ncbi:hypothetical protein BG004_007235 [Podila humilis]|nr:hypothetical protein BG004_007235 [Podila humilis]
MNDSEELNEKYHKLFQDYTRIKAQHAVLKKAVLKEQTENATMQVAMKEKEQEVRKSLQDLDLLSFHNQRLTKRIENLQTLATAKSGGGSWLGMGGGSVKKELEKSQTTLEAATIDLQAKIEENEKLHQQLYEINALYPRHVTELQGKIQTLEKQNQELQVDVQRASTANEDTTNMIRKEKQDMEKELTLIRDVLAGQVKDEQQANKSLRDKAERLENEIERLSKVEVELESLQAEHTKLQGEVETFKWISSELSELQNAYHSLERDKTQLEKAHAQLAQNYNSLKQSEDALRHALAQEQENSRTLHEKTRDLSVNLSALKEQATAEEQTRGQKIKQLETELSQARKEQEQLKVQYDELKVAEQSAKEGVSQAKSDLTRDISKIEANLSAATATIQELESAKERLENELTETKTTLEETKAILLAEQEKSASSAKAEAAAVSIASTGDEEKHNGIENKGGEKTEEESAEKESAPLSKKAKKRRAAAAAAAAAAATAATVRAAVSTETESKHTDLSTEEDKETVTRAELDRLEKSLEVQKQLDETQRTQIAELQAQIDNSREQSEATEKQLGAAQSTIVALKDEKMDLASSLGVHVDLTMQLQEEIETLKEKLDKQREHSPKNVKSSPKYRAAESPADDEHDEEPLLRKKHGQTTANDSKAEAKDESTQAGYELADKAVQSEQTATVDEGVQVSEKEMTVENAPTPPGQSVPASKDSGALPPLPIVGDEATSTSTSSTNQSNREYLIKKHYEAKLQNVTEQLQLSDGRYSRLHREFGMLKELLLETRKEKEDSDRAMDALRLKNSYLQEELTTAKEENRAQVETMTNFMRSMDPRQ